MTSRLAVVGATLGLTAPLLALVAASPAAAACTPGATPAYAGEVPTGQEVLGFELGSQEVTTEEITTYLDAVDEASDRVSVDTFATSTQGRPMDYAVVGQPDDVTAAQEASAALRDPATTPEEAATIAAQSPAIVWMAANVHGNEPSGGDAALVMLRDLADRTDCAAQLIRDNTVVVIIPTQNPDARELGQRRNTYGFDLNRDWFAATQVETQGKLDLMREYPPVLMSDNHEMGGRSFFFPPNADPVHHEVADRSVRWINKLYGGAMADWFDERDWNYFNYDVYDLLYMGYGDSVPTTQLLGASMTYEKGGDSPIPIRTEQQFGATFASMYALAEQKTSVLTGLAASYREAQAQGEAGTLEPNAVFAPGSELQLQVPKGKVRHYFLRDDDATQRQLREVVGLLQDAGVVVDRLTAPVVVPDFKPYGEPRREVTLPAGTWHVAMAQPQKHWIQAMLGEDSYVPFPYFYDVTAWSLPLLGDLDGGRSGLDLALSTAPAPNVGDLPQPNVPGNGPSVGLWKLGPGVSAYESEGWTRWLLEQKWGLDYTQVRKPDIRDNLDGIDVLLVPGGNAERALELLGRRGRDNLQDWVAGGGRFVGWRGGAKAAIDLGISKARMTAPTSDIPGSLVRTIAQPIPLMEGVGRTFWTMYEYDALLTSRAPHAGAYYPGKKQDFISGYSRGGKELRRTSAVLAEPFVNGRVVLFAGDPNFRGFTSGTQKILWNAIFADDPLPARTMPSRPAPARLPSGSTADATSLAGLGLATVPASLRSVAVTAAGPGATATPLPGGLVRVTWPVGDRDGRALLSRFLERMGSARDQVVSARVP